MTPATSSNPLVTIVMTSESYMPLMGRWLPAPRPTPEKAKRRPVDLTSVVTLYGEECARTCQTFRGASLAPLTRASVATSTATNAVPRSAWGPPLLGPARQHDTRPRREAV